MELLIVTFGLQDLSPEEYRRSCEEEAPVFADVPGLVSKTWLADEPANAYGGVYVFIDRDAVDAYLCGQLFQELSSDPHLSDVSVRIFAILEGPSRATRGLPVIAA